MTPTIPTHRKQPSAVRWWRTRADPFLEAWPVVEGWLVLHPSATAKELMERLAKIVPDVYASKAQLRTPDHMSKQNRYSPEVRERAVRLVMEHKGEHDSQWAAIESIAGKIGCTAETLRGWVRQGERDQGKRAGEIPSRPSPAIEENATLLAAWRESLEINP